MPRFLALLVGALMVMGAMGCANRVVVEPTRFGNFGDGYRISDGRIEAVVVPGLSGRVMSFGRVGGENLLWINPAIEGKRQHTPGKWINYGGDKSWVWPQNQWLTLFGIDNWPPPPAFDGEPFAVEAIRDGVRMTGPPEPKQNVRIVREVVIAEGNLRVLTRLEATGGQATLPMAPWTVTQMPFPDVVEVEDLAGWRYLVPGEWAGLEVRPGLLRLPGTLGEMAKIGADGSALVYRRGRTVLEQRIVSATPGELHPGEALQVFRTGRQAEDDAGAYIELEVSGPRSAVRPERPVELVVEWRLR